MRSNEQGPSNEFKICECISGKELHYFTKSNTLGIGTSLFFLKVSIISRCWWRAEMGRVETETIFLSFSWLSRIKLRNTLKTSFASSKGSLSVPHPLSSTHQFNTKGPVIFSPKIPQFKTKKPLSSTPKTLQFNILPFFRCWMEECVELRGMLNWGVLGIGLEILGVELRSVLNWGVLKSFKRHT